MYSIVSMLEVTASMPPAMLLVAGPSALLHFCMTVLMSSVWRPPLSLSVLPVPCVTR